MRNLIRIEFTKIVKTTYFLASFLAILTLPMLSLMLMMLRPSGFVLGDFNKLNILLLSLVVSKTIFPLVAMSLVQVGHGLAGLKSIFLTPLSRTKIVLSKVVMSLIWTSILVGFSMIMVIFVEILLFRDMAIVGIVIQSFKTYIMVVLYTFPIQMVSMLLTLYMGNMVLPAVVFLGIMIFDYIIHILYKASFLPSAIPAYLSGASGSYAYLNIGIGIHVGMGFLALVLLTYVLIHQDYMD